jgi:Predicted acyltransferases
MNKEKKLNYKNLDFIKYICSVIIIIVHMKPFFNISQPLHFVFNNVLGRFCVPFFFLLAGYFIASKEKDNKNYIDKYIKSTVKVYVVWGIIYIPIVIGFGIDNWSIITEYATNFGINVSHIIPLLLVLSPIIFILSLITIGPFYHLWYFPALILALVLLKKWKEKFRIKSLLIISFVLLLFGATETYYGIFPDFIKNLLSYYFDTFITTRNFLFFGLFYVVLGYFMGQRKQIKIKHSFLKFVLFLVLLFIEGLFLQNIVRLNSNIMLLSIPVTYYLFNFTVLTNMNFPTKLKYSFRDLSKYYYLTHALVIYITSKIVQILNIKIMSLFEVFVYIIIVIIITHILSILFIKLKGKYPKIII